MEESTYRDMSEGIYGFESRNKKIVLKRRTMCKAFVPKRHTEFSKLKEI